MKNKDIDTWVTALRSGEYIQGKGSLCGIGNLSYVNNDRIVRHCCLGVLIDELYDGDWVEQRHGFNWAIDGHESMPSNKILNDVGLSDGAADRLASWNDEGWSFEELADWIDMNRNLL